MKYIARRTAQMKIKSHGSINDEESGELVNKKKDAPDETKKRELEELLTNRTVL